MRALIQRVNKASVSCSSGLKRETGRGLVILLGVAIGDKHEDAVRLADKIAGLRIFSNADGKFDYSLLDIKGEALVVSQFTLYADCAKGRRPDFTAAAPPDIAKKLYEEFTALLKEKGIPVQTGEFAAHMEVEIINSGPVTIMLDTAG